jgi:hypothetical protein
MPEVKTSADHPASMAERVAKRLRSSGEGTNPDVMVTKGSSPTRTVTHIHHSAAQSRPMNKRTESDGEER